MGKLVKIYASECGASHIRENKPLQDFAYADTKNGLALSIGYAVVADGHGGKKYFRSADGSRLAVKTAVDAIQATLKETINDIIKKKDNVIVEKLLKHLCGSIILHWREIVIKHCAENPLSEAEKQICIAEKMDSNDEEQIPTFYGSTLIVSVYLQKLDFWFALQIGDGACFAIRQDGKIFSPIKEDEKLGFGMTTSLCGKDAINDFNFSYGFEKINGMAVMTDGFSDSFTKEKLEQFILQNLYVNTVANSVESETQLKKFLPSLSERGSGDDVSIAAFFDTSGKKAVETEVQRRVRLEVQQAMQQVKQNVSVQMDAANKRLDAYTESQSEVLKKKSNKSTFAQKLGFVFVLCGCLVFGVIIGVATYKFLFLERVTSEPQSAIEQNDADTVKMEDKQDRRDTEDTVTASENDIDADGTIDYVVNDNQVSGDETQLADVEAKSTDDYGENENNKVEFTGDGENNI